MSLNYFVKRKRTLGCYFFDLSKDGLLRAEDMENFGKNIAAKMDFQPGSDNYKKTIAGMTNYWTAFAPMNDINDDGSVTCDEMLASLETAFASPNAREGMEQLNIAMFDAMDVNGNGTISLEEYTIFLGAAGVSADTAEKAFRKLDQDNSGVMSRAEFSQNAWEYWTSEDPNARGNWFYGNH